MQKKKQVQSKLGDKSNSTEYHGIIIDFSQKDKSIFDTVEIIGRRKYFFGLMNIYKVKVPPGEIKKVIKSFQANMTNRFLLSTQEYYLHFYRDDELIIVYRDKVFNVSPDNKTWDDAVAYGKKMRIAANQLDFYPNRFEDEDF